MRLPFDIASLHLMGYTLDASGSPTTVEADRDAVRSRLVACKNPVEDSPLFQVLTDWPRPEITRLKTDTFRESVDYSQKYKARLAAARDKRPEPLSQIESELDIPTTDPLSLLTCSCPIELLRIGREWWTWYPKCRFPWRAPYSFGSKPALR
jgi:hypothetical protein